MSRIAVVTLIALRGAACPAHASLSQTVIAAPGGFVQAAAYPAANGCMGSTLAGDDFSFPCGLGADFHEQAFSGAGSASTGAANSTPGAAGPLNQSIAGSAALGSIRASGSNAYTDYASFANAILDGGWNESFTVSHPSLSGQRGYLVFRLHARGQMHTQGLSGSALVEISPYKDHAPILWNPYYAQEGSDSGTISGGNQHARWGLASYGLPDNRSVDAYVTMSVPITFGTPFTLGVYARFVAAQRSSGGFNDPSSDWLDFSAHGVEWAGITGVLNAGGASVSGATIVSGSGINWLPPVGSCDPDANADGNVDQDDIAYLVDVVGGGANPTAFDPDFNHDGNVDQADVDALVDVVAGGACP